jgi:hypothetical protein
LYLLGQRLEHLCTFVQFVTVIPFKRGTGSSAWGEHMFKRMGVVCVAAVLASVALAVPATADHTEARLTLQIDPKEGTVGTPIDATVPEEYKEVCLSENEFVANFQTLVGQIVGEFEFSPTIEALLRSIATLPNLTADDLNFTLLFVLAFADIATQQPVVDETTGQQATAFWDPATGQGTIETPNVHPRPSLYAVAAVCLRLKTLDEVNPEEVAQALGSLGANPDPEAAAQTLLLVLINQDPDIAWAALYCLLGDNGEPCGTSTAAEAVTAEPAFTG